MLNGKIIAVDIDNTICKIEKKFIKKNNKYFYCKPIKSNIKLVNSLYSKGYFIKLYTARGMTTYNKNIVKIKKNLSQVTKTHLKKWGVKYHELIFGKEIFDYLIDDKAINITDKVFLKKKLKLKD